MNTRQPKFFVCMVPLGNKRRWGNSTRTIPNRKHTKNYTVRMTIPLSTAVSSPHGKTKFTAIDNLDGYDFKPQYHTTVTFDFEDPDKAGKCLELLTSRTTYPDALSLISAAEIHGRSANYNENQLVNLITPVDFWACVIYREISELPLVQHGGYGDVNETLLQASTKGRVAVPSADYDMSTLFHLLTMSAISLFS